MFYKWINVKDGELQNRDYKFNIGLNVVENFNAIRDCTSNALYFCDEETVHKYMSFGNTLYIVSTPEDATVVKFDGKYKTDRLIIEEKVDERKTKEVYLKAIKCNGYNLQYVPDHLKTVELCLEAIKFSDKLDGIPHHRLCVEAIKRNKHVLEYIPEHLKTAEICFEVVKYNGYALERLLNYALRLDEYYELVVELLNHKNEKK